MAIVPLLIAAVAGYFYLTGGPLRVDRQRVRPAGHDLDQPRRVGPDRRGQRQENQRVKAGDVLFVIDQEPYRIALAQADAALATARVQVATMSTDTGSAAADIASATPISRWRRRPMTARRR